MKSRQVRGQEKHRSVVAFSESLEARRLLAGLTLDAFSGTRGISFGRPEDQWSFESGLVAPLADGRTYVGDTGPQGLLGRFLRDGNVDRSFGNNGFINVNPEPLNASLNNYFGLRKMIARDDGSLLVVGTTGRWTDPSHTESDITLWQYRADGTLDPNFGTGGRVDVSVTTRDGVSDVAQFPEGKIVVVGTSIDYYNASPKRKGVIARLKADGTLDTAAPGGGVEIVNEYSTSNRTETYFDQIVPTNDGGYLVAGRKIKTTTTQYLIRFDATDQRHTDFGTGGELRDNRYAGGVGTYAYDADHDAFITAGMTLTRFDADTAALDTTLGPNGTRTIATPGPYETRGFRTLIDSEGIINVLTFTNYALAFMRFTADGTAIGSNSLTTAPTVGFGNSDSYGFALTAGGQIVATAHVRDHSVAPNAPLSLIRLNTFGVGAMPRLFRETNGNLNVFLNDLADAVSIRRDQSDLVLSWSGGELRTPLAGLSRIVLADGGGNDAIELGDVAGLAVDVDLGAGDNLLRLLPGADAGAIRVVGSAGDDRVERSTSSSVTSLAFTGDDGVDTLAYLGSGGADTIVIDAQSIGRSTTAPTQIAGVESFDVLGFAGSDVVKVIDTPAGVTLDLDAGDDVDSIDVTGRAAGTIRGGAGDDVIIVRQANGTHTIDGGDGDDSLHLIANVGSTGVSYSGGVFGEVRQGATPKTTPAAIESVSVTGPNLPTGSFFSVADDALTVGHSYAVSGNSYARTGIGYTITLANFLFVTISAGSGDDTLVSTAAPGGLRVGFLGNGGTDRFELDRSNDPRATTYSIDASFYGVNEPPTPAAVEYATIRGGAGNDRFEVSAKTNRSVVWTLDGGGGQDILNVAIASASTPAKVLDTPQSGRITFGNRSPIEFVSIESSNLIAPRVLSARFDAARETVIFTLETAAKAVELHPSQAFITLVNLKTGQTSSSTDLSASVSETTLVVRKTNGVPPYGTPPGTPFQMLEDGDYRITIRAAESLQDTASNVFGGELAFDFYVFQGDINRDRTVNFDDLIILAQNYGRRFSDALASFPRGDANHDSYVNFDDLVIIAQKYNQTLAPPLPLMLVISSDRSTPRKRRDPIVLA